jgi:hypothetical protein
LIIPRFGTIEIVFESSIHYSGEEGTPNPFCDVALTCSVAAPGGEVRPVGGFYDGDGEGGQNGRVFKVRICPDEIGQWSWSSESNDPSLRGRSGSFVCQGELEGVYADGPIEVDPERPRYFRHRQGDPVYLIGKFLDIEQPEPLRFSHTMFSEERSEQDRQNLLDRHVQMGCNKINIYLANRDDYDGPPTTPWLGSASNNDKCRFDLQRWRIYESWIRRLRDAGMVAQLWYFADDSGFGDLPDRDKSNLVCYGMTRLSAFANTMYTLALEWQEGWSRDEVSLQMGVIQGSNPWDRQASVHGTTGDFAFADQDWADYMDIQSGNGADHQTVHQMTIANRNLAEKPLINEEFGLGVEDRINREKAWAAFMGGAAGSGTGAYLGALRQFTSMVPFADMVPSPDLVLDGHAYALSDGVGWSVFYLFDGGEVTVLLPSGQGTRTGHWYDPRQGTMQTAGNLGVEDVSTFQAPGSEDWVLYITVE